MTRLSSRQLTLKQKKEAAMKFNNSNSQEGKLEEGSEETVRLAAKRRKLIEPQQQNKDLRPIISNRNIIILEEPVRLLVSMKHQHKHDPPLPKDVIQKIFEPVAEFAKVEGTTPVTSAVARDDDDEEEAKRGDRTSSSFTALTTQCDVDIALDLLSMGKPSFSSSSSSTNGRPVPVSPTDSDSSETTTPKGNKFGEKTMGTNSGKRTKDIGHKIPLASEPTLPIILHHPKSYKDCDPSDIVRHGVDPSDGSPTIVRNDGGVMRELKEHHITNSCHTTPVDSRTIHDEQLKEGWLVPLEEDLKTLPTPRQKKAFHTFVVRLNELRQYIQRYGDANVPQQFPEAHSLGIWVNKMRMEKKKWDLGEKTNLNDRKIELLEFYGFVWAQNCKGEIGWEIRFQELMNFKKQYNHCNVPTKSKENRALGRWVSTQRSMYKSFKDGAGGKSLNKEEMERRITLLQEQGFVFSMLPGEEDGDDATTTTS